jgi:hypothetical protein
MRRARISSITLAAFAAFVASLLVALTSAEKVWYVWSAVCLGITLLSLALSLSPVLDGWLNDRLNAITGEPPAVEECLAAPRVLEFFARPESETSEERRPHLLGVAGPEASIKPAFIEETRQLARAFT